MSEPIDQTQKGGINSTNLQIAKVEITGLTYNDVKEIALDVFKQNAEKLSQKAVIVFEQRASEITDIFLRELQKRNPDGLKKAEDPDFQVSLLTAQREYARSGDKELGDLLVDLLVDRSRSEQRDIMQIVLNESLAVAPKLTTEQLASLAVVFILSYTRRVDLTSHQLFQDYLKTTIIPHVPLISKKNTCYQHLEFSGCGTTGLVGRELPDIFKNSYPGLFTEGFNEEGMKQQIPEMIGSSLIMRSLCNPTKLQINALDETSFEAAAEKAGLSKAVQEKAKSLWKGHLLPNEQIKVKVIELVPEMDQVFEVWKGSLMKQLNLTSVGMAIAHAYARSKTGLVADLSIWIN
jgi:hypothetical protein